MALAALECDAVAESGINSYRDLAAWQQAHALGLSVYRVTASFPGDERFGLVSQVRRAAISVASNIAEGYGRGSRQDYLRFLRIARGSLFEIETQLLFAKDLGFLSEIAFTEIQQLIGATARPLSGLIRSLENG